MSVIIGVVGAVVFILVGMIMKGGTIGGIISPPAFLMVMGGSTCVMIACCGLKNVMAMPKLIMGVAIKERPDTRAETIRTLVGFSERARREGLLVLEDASREVEDPFLSKGIRLVVDGTDPELVKDILEAEIESMEERHHTKQDPFKQGGAFAPTIGILATVLSLVSVLQHLNEPARLGPAISAAFLATFYGVAAANVFFLPIAGALKRRTEEEIGERTLMVEGVLSIQSGDNPRILAEKLWSFLPPDARETGAEAEGAEAPAGEPVAQAA